MTCPTCSNPLLFGSRACSCGWTSPPATRSAVDLSHREAVAVFWRIGWTATLFSISAMFVSVQVMVMYMGGPRTAELLTVAPLQWLLPQIWWAIAIFLFTPLIVRWPYRRFTLIIVTDSSQAGRFQFTQRIDVALFIFWRTLVATFLVQLILLPMNILFGLIRVSFAAPLTLATTVFLAGPLIIRFLIGHQFATFRVEVDRSSPA